mmetsp:Transcript_10792/g.16435  ORF Transcript_10792/g.16435 Transcript_10792/m.16435 type:complete len:91 (-) Transcript_10792:7-279(-)
MSMSHATRNENHAQFNIHPTALTKRPDKSSSSHLEQQHSTSTTNRSSLEKYPGWTFLDHELICQQTNHQELDKSALSSFTDVGINLITHK